MRMDTVEFARRNFDTAQAKTLELVEQVRLVWTDNSAKLVETVQATWAKLYRLFSVIRYLGYKNFNNPNLRFVGSSKSIGDGYYYKMISKIIGHIKGPSG